MIIIITSNGKVRQSYSSLIDAYAQQFGVVRHLGENNDSFRKRILSAVAADRFK